MSIHLGQRADPKRGSEHGHENGARRENSPGIDLVILVTHNLPMIKANIHAVKTHLSRYLVRVAAGETIVICNRNVPVAEIRPVRVPRTARRPIGLARGTFEVPAAFFEPLPEDELERWEGKSR
jgi:antitoxin (DNA-binding transcriptional repressor) of toxin-antitoxin stability system